MKNYQSPNFDDRKAGRIKYLILHYTGMATGREAIERLCDEKAAVSAHYVVEEDGEIFQLVDEDKRAWHAGISKWEDDEGVNDLSIGIEIVNSGHAYPGYESHYRAFAEAQMRAVIKLTTQITERHNIKACHVLGHSDIAWRRKIDPGELFDWKRLADHGIGLWPHSEPDEQQAEISIDEFLCKLQIYGYDIQGCEENPQQIITAFQRHFRQSNIDGRLDVETVQIIDKLLEKKAS